MDTFEAISKRVSIREYKKDPVDKKFLEKLVDAGRRAPSARKVEPWEFIVVTDRAKLQDLGRIANTGAFIKDAAACIIIYSKDTKYYLEDSVAATENILIAVSALGLGACWVAGDKKPYVNEVSNLLGVPVGMKLVCLIPIGWPLKEIRQEKSRTLSDVVHYEKF